MIFFIRTVKKLDSLYYAVISWLFLLPKLKESTTIQRFRHFSKTYSQLLILFGNNDALQRGSDCYSWDSWSGQIRSAFQDMVPINFLSHDVIRYTMVYGGGGIDSSEVNTRIMACRDILGDLRTRVLLTEDYLGMPTICDSNFMTSANRAHHASHLAYYYKMSSKYLWDVSSIIEWGGGYGSMARIVRRINPSLTYIIADLPELLALQYVYLASLLGPDDLHIIDSDASSIAIGKINLVSSELLITGKVSIQCATFLSTWALTECPEYIQRFVYNSCFLGARNVFIASCIDDNNYLKQLAGQSIVKRHSITSLNGRHEYWLINN
jgi:hypothetical protein